MNHSEVIGFWDKYYVIVHDLVLFFGYPYDDTVPDWKHPIIHLIFVLAPALLLAVLLSFVMRGLIEQSRRQPPQEPQASTIRGLDPSLFKTVLNYSRKQQVLMIILSLIAMPILYLTLELPKQIVNSALEADRFPITFLGYEFEQVILLMTLSGLYLLAISVSGLNKYVLNVFKGYVAERFLRRFRLLVYRQWRRDPNAGDQSEIVPILAQEVEPIGGFAADVLKLPVL